MGETFDIILENLKWIFSGIGVFIIAIILKFSFGRKKNNKQDSTFDHGLDLKKSKKNNVSSEEVGSILKIIADTGGEFGAHIDDIAIKSRLHDARCRYHLKILENSGLVKNTSPGDYPSYKITDKGNAFLVQNNIV